MTRVTLPRISRNRRGVEFDPAACEKAVHVIGLQYPVVVKWSRGKTRMGGHRWKEDHHSITINMYVDGYRASQYLWHELAHAMQVERHGWDTYWMAYGAYGKSGRAYDANPFELEANMIQEQFNEALRLTKLEGA